MRQQSGLEFNIHLSTYRHIICILDATECHMHSRKLVYSETIKVFYFVIRFIFGNMTLIILINLLNGLIIFLFKPLRNFVTLTKIEYVK